MIFNYNKKDSFMKCLYALCLIGRSDPDNELINQTITILLPYKTFNKEKFNKIYKIYKSVNYQLMLTDGFKGIKKKNTKQNWDKEIAEIENYLKILNVYIIEQKHSLVKQMSYSMHNFPLAIYKNDKENYDEFKDNNLLKLSIKEELMES